MISRREAMIKVLRHHLGTSYECLKLKGHVTFQRELGDGFIARITHIESATKPVSVCIQYKSHENVSLINFIEPKVPIDKIETTVSTLYENAKQILQLGE